MTQTILIRRTGALGDVLEVTAITARLKKENPTAQIDLETAYETVFKNNPDIHSTRPTRTHYDKIYDLNMAFENKLRLFHPIDAYSEIVFGDYSTPHELHLTRTPIVNMNSNLVVLHAARSWPIRTLPREFWQELINQLLSRGYVIALTGTKQDWDGLHGALDMRDKLDLASQAGLIDAACAFVCSESGPMILAQTTNTPIIPLLTMIPAEHVTHLRQGWYGWRWRPILANVPCVGCAVHQPASVTYFDCLLGHRNCVNSFDPKMVADHVDRHRIFNPSGLGTNT